MPASTMNLSDQDQIPLKFHNFLFCILILVFCSRNFKWVKILCHIFYHVRFYIIVFLWYNSTKPQKLFLFICFVLSLVMKFLRAKQAFLKLWFLHHNIISCDFFQMLLKYNMSFQLLRLSHLSWYSMWNL